MHGYAGISLVILLLSLYSSNQTDRCMMIHTFLSLSSSSARSICFASSRQDNSTILGFCPLGFWNLTIFSSIIYGLNLDKRSNSYSISSLELSLPNDQAFFRICFCFGRRAFLSILVLFFIFKVLALFQGCFGLIIFLGFHKFLLWLDHLKPFSSLSFDFVASPSPNTTKILVFPKNCDWPTKLFSSSLSKACFNSSLFLSTYCFCNFMRILQNLRFLLSWFKLTSALFPFLGRAFSYFYSLF